MMGRLTADTEEERVLMMRKGFGVTVVLLVLVIVFCVKGTFYSKENNERARENRYYAVLEEEYRQEARRLLEEQGYGGCGVTMTRITYADGSREYTVLLHHSRLQGLSAGERAELFRALEALEFGGESEACEFCYEL